MGRKHRDEVRIDLLNMAGILVGYFMQYGTPEPERIGGRGRPRKTNGMTLEAAAEHVSQLAFESAISNQQDAFPDLVATLGLEAANVAKGLVDEDNLTKRYVASHDAKQAYLKLFGPKSDFDTRERALLNFAERFMGRQASNELRQYWGLPAVH